jgi:pSer/pThr/pTyr-binding forkhead associated (FHA) protein
MAKLVVLSAGMTGRTHELKVDKTTVGRVEDNTFQISEPSISSHHCEILLKGTDVLVRDLGSTNGSFINGEKITEAVLKPNQILRLGQIELRLEPETVTGPAKKVDQTMVMQRGVSLTELEQGARTAGFDTAGAGFSKKENKTNKIFIIAGVIVAVVIIVLLIWVLLVAGKASN